MFRMTSMLTSSEGTKIQTDDRDHHCGLYSQDHSVCIASVDITIFILIVSFVSFKNI